MPIGIVVRVYQPLSAATTVQLKTIPRDCGDRTELLSTPSLQIEGWKTYNVIMSVDDTSQGLQTFNGLNAFKAQGCILGFTGGNLFEAL